MKKRTLEQTVEEVKAFLLTVYRTLYHSRKMANLKAVVVLWETSGYAGVRVAEVGFSDIDPKTGLGGGSSWMQCDPACFAMCFAVERLILALTRHRLDTTDDWTMQEEVEDAKWGVLQAFVGNDRNTKKTEKAYQKIAHLCN